MYVLLRKEGTKKTASRGYVAGFRPARPSGAYAAHLAASGIYRLARGRGLRLRGGYGLPAEGQQMHSQHRANAERDGCEAQ